jgi:PPP family 3-phenylpropionic acid transporter
MGHLSLKIGLFYFAAYSAYACFFPFLTLYFQERGMSFTEIGIAYAIISIISIIAQPIWGVVTDKYFSKKPVLIALMGICAVIIYNFVFANSFIYILFSIVLLIIFQDSISPIADAYAYDIIEHNKNMQFGKIRLMGSAGWSISALILGYVIKGYGMNAAFYIYSACMIFGILLVYSINFSSKTVREQVRFSDIANLIKEYRFMLIMLSLAVANIAIGCNNSFLPVLIEKTGGDVAKLGLMQFLIALSELPVFFYGTRFVKKYGELNLYLLSMVLFFIRFFLNSFCSSYEQVILYKCCNALLLPSTYWRP